MPSTNALALAGAAAAAGAALVYLARRRRSARPSATDEVDAFIAEHNLLKMLTSAVGSALSHKDVNPFFTIIESLSCELDAMAGRGMLTEYREKGHDGYELPLALRVEEVSAMQQAQTRLRGKLDDIRTQLSQLEAQDKTNMTPIGLKMHEDAAKGLCAQEALTLDELPVLEQKFLGARDATISRYTPQLMASVHTFDEAYQELAGGKAALLQQLARTCRRFKDVPSFRTKAQPLPDGVDARALTTLLLLMDRADRARPVLAAELERLQRHVTAAVVAAEVKVKHGPLKGLQRCMAKTQAEYIGRYDKLLDLVRATVVVDSLDALCAALEWLCAEGTTSLRVCRAKDRMSDAWDPEQSGGNRDVLLNVEIALPPAEAGGGAAACVTVGEVQLHLRPLFRLKADLHVLYTGARVLGAMDDNVAVHHGSLTPLALERAQKGIVRRLKCDYSDLGGPDGVAQLRALLSTQDGLLELHLAGQKGFEEMADQRLDMPLAALLLAPGGALVCSRLRELNLSRRMLSGEIPKAIGECARLEVLKLGNNSLSGPIPKELGRCRFLRTIGFNMMLGGGLSGPIPEEVGGLEALHTLSADGNSLSGDVPWAAFSRCKRLAHLYLDQNQLTGGLSEEILTWQSLEVLQLDRNQLGGELPPAWIEAEGGLPKLTKLKLAANPGPMRAVSPAFAARLKKTDVKVREAA